MHIDVARYAPARSSLRVRGAVFMAIGLVCASVTGLVAWLGVAIAFERTSVHPRESFLEGALIFAFGAVPTLLLALLFARGLRHWSNAARYDRLVDLARRFPGIGVADAAKRLGLAQPTLAKLASAGATSGFVAEPDGPVVFASTSATGTPPKAMYAPGRTPLLAVLVSYATGLVATAIMLTAMADKSGSSHSGIAALVGSAATLTTASLDLVGIVGGIASLVTARRMDPPASATRSVFAIVLGVLGFVGVLALAALTLLNVI